MRRLRFRLLLAAGATLLALLLAEGAFRIATPSHAPRTGQGAVVPGGEAGPFFRLVPGSRFEHVWDGDPYGVLPEGARLTYQLDPIGYRSGDAMGRPSALVVLGDSFTFGEGVAIGDRFTERLDAALGAPGVFNAGVPGWSTLDQVAVLPELLAARRPRAVLVVAQPNDAVPITHAQQRAEGDLLALSGGGGLRLVALVRGAAAARDTEDWYRSYWLGANRRFGDEVGLALRLAAETCAARRARLGVTCFPLLHRLDDAPLADVHAEIGRKCAAAGIPFLDLAPAFAGRDESALWVHPADHHPNAAAHAIAAEALEPFVRELLR
jgi:lysophospholipase L1-like esterase